MHHGTMDAVRRQVLHGRQLLPEGVLVHLPYRGLLAMRTLTLTRRFVSRQQIPLSGTPPFVGPGTGCVVVGVPWVEAHR